jgi:uncharacterized membrane protein YgcG
MGYRARLAGLAFAAALGLGWLALVPTAGGVAGYGQAGPPYPEPVTGQRVYDNAGIFSPAAIADAEATILAIEERTGAQVAVYTQVKPESDSLDKANADARALMDQWGVGRKGFDDGLVILFDMEYNLRHGQVSLYAGSGFKAAFLTNAERQSIFDNEMLPRLKNADFDGALAAALEKVDAAATPEHAQFLERARLLNAIVGIFGAGIAIWLIFFVVIRWNQHGRDPVYIDDNSVLMPAPPEGLTPAMATLLMTNGTSSRTVSAAMIDLAARGLIAFREERGVFGAAKAGIVLTKKPGEVQGPESTLMSAIRSAGDLTGYVRPEKMSDLATDVSEFKSRLEKLAVSKGWMKGIPGRAIAIWCGVAVAEFAVGGALLWWTASLDASGGLLGSMAFMLAGVVTLIVAQFMPSRTPVGSMLRAMLAAYKRTLQATMAQSQSLGEVVKAKALPWATTPDQVMAWGVAFGLNDEIDAVMDRTVAAAKAGSKGGWYPGWWYTSGGHSSGFVGGGGSGGSSGLFSASAIPDVGSMMAVLGSVGSSASHSGGGSFGGGGGGGGGGAGGGF